MEEWIRKDLKYRGRVVSFWAGEARLDDGSVVEREVVTHPGGVAIVPVLGDSVILVRQYRIAVGRPVLEIPAGRLEGGEDPAACALRELEEEIGYRPVRLVPAVSYYVSAGYTDERLHIFLAFELEETVERPEPDERIEQVRIPLVGLESRLDAGDFDDSKTIIGLRELISYRGREKTEV